MTLTEPYEQNNYMGEYANEADALTFIQANKWDSAGDGTGTPQVGMQYYDTTLNKQKVYNGTVWITLPLHAVDHENAGVDEINVAGLSGVLADNQNPVAHNLAGSEHNADTLANLNSKISDGQILPILTGAGSPHSSVSGILGQTYRDTTNSIWYICISNPTGTDWEVL